MPVTVKTVAPRVDGHINWVLIKSGQVFEARAFSASDLEDVPVGTKIQYGTILDPGPKKGIKLVRFVFPE